MPYKFEREDLVKILMRAYNEGHYGFLDLSESVAERLIEENEDKYEQDLLTQEGYFNLVDDQAHLAGVLPDVEEFNLQCQTGDNLIAVNSNQGHWEPYSEVDLIRKET